MHNKLFKPTLPGPTLRPTGVTNEAGGPAYSRTEEGALAQFAATGCFGSTFYSTATEQLNKTLELLQKADPTFAAQVAIYARESGYMKDQPTLITVGLAGRLRQHFAELNSVSDELGKARKGSTEVVQNELVERLNKVKAKLSTREALIEERDLRIAATAAFGRVIDDGRMLKGLVKIVRSGVTGRKALASGFLRRMIQMWFDGHTDEQLFWSSVGQDPSLLDVIKLARVNPRTPQRRAFFKWLANQDAGAKDHLGFAYDPNDLPKIVKDFEAWKLSKEGAPPRVPFQMLTALELTPQHWAEIAKRASWKEARQSINTYARHGVFKIPGMTEVVAKKLSDKELVAKAKCFPYQLNTTYRYIEHNADVPQEIKTAIQFALDHALSNIPEIDGHVVVCPDASGSMKSPVTGDQDNDRKGATARTGRPSGATTVVSCKEVAALIAAAFMRRQKRCTVLPFNERVYQPHLNPLDSIVTNTAKLSALPEGGTNCSLPLAHLNNTRTKADLVIYVSDYESWMDANGTTAHAVGWGTIQRSTGLMEEWAKFKSQNPNAKLVCIDLTPQYTQQAIEREDILSVGGFSDRVFDVISTFYKEGVTANHWLQVIKSIKLVEDAPVAVAATAEDEIDE